MAAKPKRLTSDDWAAVRDIWEGDARDGYAWIVREQSLPVSRVAVSKRSSKEGWEKKTASKPAKKEVKVTQAPKVTQKPKAVTKSVTTVTKVTDSVTTVDEEHEVVKAKIGRPTDYRDKYAEQAYKLCLLGATDKQLADFFNVHESTINDWKLKHDSFRESIHEGKFFADANVAQSLYERATGYDHEAIHFATIDGRVVETPYTKHHAPDPWAASWWLKNRQPHLWKDKVEVREEINVNVFPPREQLDAIYEKALAEAEEVEMRIVHGRAERLGINLDGTGSDDE